EVVHRLLLKLLEKVLGISERIVDEGRELARRLLVLSGRKALPEEAVVPQLRTVVKQLLVLGAMRLAHHLEQRSGAERRVVGDQFVGFGDIGLVMLAVVVLERFG